MSREIKFRFWTPDKRMIEDHDGWVADIGINEAIQASIGYGYILMQFTGILDKNKNKIFEGDIIKYQHSKDSTQYTGEIFYKNESAAFHIRTSDDSGFALLGHQKIIEIIGNVYSHPELIPTK